MVAERLRASVSAVSLGLGAVGVGAVDGFVDAGDDYGGVALVPAGSVDGVLVPATVGWALVG